MSMRIKDSYESQLVFGEFDDKKIVHRHGISEVGQLTDGQPTSIWAGALDVPGQKPLPSDDGEILYIFSSSADDASGGDGATEIELIGLDPQGLDIREKVITNGQTGVATTKKFSRICGAEVTAGSQVGNIFIATSDFDPTDPDLSGSIYNKIPVTGYSTANNFGKGVSQQACFTIPAGWVGYIKHFSFDRETGSADTVAYLRYKKRGEDQWKVLETKNITGGPAYGSNSTMLEELTDIDCAAVVDTGTEEVGADITVELRKIRDVISNPYGSLTFSNVDSDGFTTSWNTPYSDNYDEFQVVVSHSTEKDRVYNTRSNSITFTGLTNGEAYTVTVSTKKNALLGSSISGSQTVGLPLPTAAEPFFMAMHAVFGPTPTTGAYTYSTDMSTFNTDTFNVAEASALSDRAYLGSTDEAFVLLHTPGDNLAWKRDGAGTETNVDNGLIWSRIHGTSDNSFMIRETGANGNELSTDGVSWTSVTGFTALSDIVKLGANYYAVNADGNIIVSTDSGLTWNVTASQPAVDSPSHLAATATQLFVGGTNTAQTDIQYAVTTDPETSWSSLTSNWTDDGSTVLVSGMVSDGTYVYSVVSNNVVGVLESSNSGNFSAVTTTYSAFKVFNALGSTYINTLDASQIGVDGTATIYLAEVDGTGGIGTETPIESSVPYFYRNTLG